ncbi:MAG: hypothetical protein ACRD8W_19885 [Nitrososphaeraceae archaeon]
MKIVNAVFLGERNKDARFACQQGDRGGTGFPIVKFKIKDRMEFNTNQNN